VVKTISDTFPKYINDLEVRSITLTASVNVYILTQTKWIIYIYRMWWWNYEQNRKL